MKKALSLILSISMLICLFSCGGNNETPKAESGNAAVETPKDETNLPAEVESEKELTPEDLTKKYFESMFALDCDALFDMCVDPASVKAALDSGEYADEAALREYFTKGFLDAYEETVLALGDNRKITRFEVLETKNIPVSELGESVQFVFGSADASIDAIGLQECVVVTASITVTGDNDEISVESGNTPIVKIGDKWYVGTYLMSASSAKTDTVNLQ